MTASAAPGGTPTPRVLADRYRLDSVIGKGSMGTVWAATDLVLHRNVAIKEIDFPVGTPAGERRQLEQRTLREARAIAALSNPYVITLFDILTVPAGPVIVMELLHSRSLADILKRVGRLPDGQAATIGVAVASGLLAAHAAGITHRDVKPANVLICDDGRIKLTDFGIARSSAENTMTATGLLLGSPAYIAPEVASGTPAGPVSDAWSLGGLLFACVEGRPPFDQGTAIATLTSVVKDPVPPHPHSGRLGAVVSGLLVKTPNLRMRIEKSLQIMRGIADDPSGTYLAAVSRIPRSEWPGFGRNATTGSHSMTPPPAPGAGRQQNPAARSLPPVRSSGPSASPARPVPGGPGGAPLHSTQRPPAMGDSSFAFRPAAPPVGPPPGDPASGTASPTGRPDDPARPQDSAQFSRNMPLHGIQQAAGQAGPGFGTRAEPLPPPPWAQADAAALPPLPDVAPEPSAARRIAVAVVVALLAAVAGFFAVRLIADAADGSAAAPPTAIAPASPGPQALAPALGGTVVVAAPIGFEPPVV
ncbi:protein kinase domain-containing protein [Nakamurella sp.]|uniref:serine/threonine-protein kinase n=1 Tax=Nakamurella sp. TaxID=1869182 RepID=UPI003783D100